MRKNHLVLFLSLLFVFMYISINNVVLAEEMDQNEQNVETGTDTEISENKQLALKSINECKEEIRQEISKIDSKLSKIKEKDEYKNYPAIRLNIDTPIFGLVSVCNQKLKITSEVSAADVARGYSIKDIIQTNSLKVPSFSVGSIVVITRDIKFDENITLSDANTCILKLMQYFEQVESVNEFLDKQIIKIYSEYIPKEKQEKISDLKSRLTNIKNGMKELDKNLTKINLSRIDNEKYIEYQKIYIDINNKIYNYQEILENVLIDDDTLTEYEKNVVNLEAINLQLKQSVNELNTNMVNNLDFETIFANLRNDMQQRRDNVAKYINEASIKQEIKNVENVDENIENTEELNNENNNIEQATATEEIKVYDVTDTQLIDTLNSSLSSLDEKIKENLGETILNRIKGVEYTSDINEEVVNKEEVTNIVTKELSDDEKDKLLEELYNLYKEFLSTENKFYLDNINMLIKDTTNKISSLSKYTDYSSISDIKYIYLELPDLLEKDVSLYNLDLVIEISSFTNNIKNRLNRIIEVNKIITKEYNEKITEDLKNSSRNN